MTQLISVIVFGGRTFFCSCRVSKVVLEELLLSSTSTDIFHVTLQALHCWNTSATCPEAFAEKEWFILDLMFYQSYRFKKQAMSTVVNKPLYTWRRRLCWTISFSMQTVKMFFMGKNMKRRRWGETCCCLVLRVFFLSCLLHVEKNGFLPPGLPRLVRGGNAKYLSSVELSGWLVAFHPVLMGLDSLYSK